MENWAAHPHPPKIPRSIPILPPRAPPTLPAHREERLLRKAIAVYLPIRIHSFAIIWVRIKDPRSLGPWRFKGTYKSFIRMDSSVPLIHHDPSDLG